MASASRPAAGPMVRHGPADPHRPPTDSDRLGSFRKFFVLPGPERERSPASAHEATGAGPVERLVRVCFRILVSGRVARPLTPRFTRSAGPATNRIRVFDRLRSWSWPRLRGQQRAPWFATARPIHTGRPPIPIVLALSGSSSFFRGPNDRAHPLAQTIPPARVGWSDVLAVLSSFRVLGS